LISETGLCAFRELRRSRWRSIAVAAGYALTVIMMLVTASVIIFAKIAENKILAATGTNFVCYMPNCGDITSLTEEEIAQLARGIIPQKCQELCKNCTGCNKKPYDLLNEGFVINTNTTRLLSLELITKIKALASVSDASGYLMFRFRDPVSGRLFSVGGFDPSSRAAESILFSADDVVSGEVFAHGQTGKGVTACCSKSELKAGTALEDAGHVMIDAGFASGWGLSPGSSITIADEVFKVSGIVNTGVRPGKADVYMLFNDAERVMNRRIQNPLFQEANIILVESADAKMHDQAIADVKTLVQSDAIVTYNCYQPAAAAIGLNEKSVWFFLLIIALGTVLFAARTQLAAVIERRRSFAVLRAIGWKESSIVLQILTESAVLSIAGCLTGATAGLALLKFFPVGKILGIEAEPAALFNIYVLLLLMFFALFSAALTSLVPVVIILKQHPAEALRQN